MNIAYFALITLILSLSSLLICAINGYIGRIPGIKTIRLANGRIEAIYKRSCWLVQLWKWFLRLFRCRKTRLEEFPDPTEIVISSPEKKPKPEPIVPKSFSNTIRLLNDIITEKDTYAFAKCTNYKKNNRVEVSYKKADTVVTIHEPPASQTSTRLVRPKTKMNGSLAVPPGSIPDPYANLDTLPVRRIVPPLTISRPIRLRQAVFNKCLVIKRMFNILDILEDLIFVMYFNDRNGNACLVDDELDRVPTAIKDFLQMVTKEDKIWVLDRKDLTKYPMLPIQLATNHKLRMNLHSVLFMPLSTRYGHIIAEIWSYKAFSQEQINLLLLSRNILQHSRHTCYCRLPMPGEVAEVDEEQPSTSKQ